MKIFPLVSFLLLISFSLSSQQSGDLEELVVSGIFIPDEKRSTSEISNVINSTEMSDAGDSNIAEALKRVSGLSLVKDKYLKNIPLKKKTRLMSSFASGQQKLFLLKLL